MPPGPTLEKRTQVVLSPRPASSKSNGLGCTLVQETRSAIKNRIEILNSVLRGGIDAEKHEAHEEEQLLEIMKKLILILTTVLISGNVSAEWTRIDGGADDSDLYVDMDTFRRNGSKIKLWTMHNFKTWQGAGNQKYQSNKIQWELDCKEEQVRMPARLDFTGKKGAGRPVSTVYAPNDSWWPPTPQTLGEVVFNAGCHTPEQRKWTLLRSTSKENIDFSFYYDLSRIERSESRVTMPVLFDAKGKDHTGIKNYSMQSLQEYDCAELQTRDLGGMMFTANMGLGKNSSRIDPTPWEPVSFEKISAELWLLACGSAVSN